MVFLASVLALGLAYPGLSWVVSGKFGSVIRAIRDDEARVRFLGYSVEGYKLFVFTLTAVMLAIAGRSIIRWPALSTRQSLPPSPRSIWRFG